MVDPDAVIDPYVCVNYKSAICFDNKDLLHELLLDEMSCDKITITSEPPMCVHALGVITDCKHPIGESVNCHMTNTFSTFSYVSCHDAISLKSPDCYMCCVDLQSAYRSVNIHPDDRKFCGRQCDFGEGPVWLTESYFDDFFLVEQTKEKCTESMNTLLIVLRRLGFYISYKKLSPPSQA